MLRLTAGAFLLTLATLCWGPEVQAQNRDPNKITAEDIAEKPDQRNAIELIRILRPQWLRVRPSGNIGSSAPDRFSTGRAEPALYIDENRMSTGLAELQNVKASEIREMRYMGGNHALARYGNGHEYGAIFVTTIRRRP